MRFTLLALALAVRPVVAQVPSVYIEGLTWPEIRSAIASGYTSAIIYAGSTEQNGPHMVTGKHNFVAHEVAGRIAHEMGKTLVYPTLPFAPTGTIAPKAGHMRFPGSVTLKADTYRAVVEDVAASAIAAGFTRVFIMGDHGTGQDQLERVARDLDATGPAGVHVYYIRDLYYGSRTQDSTYLLAHGIPTTEHAGPGDTSELLALDSARKWIRRDKLGASAGRPEPETGVTGDPTKATVAMGNVFLKNKVNAAVAEMRRMLAQ